MRYRNYYDCGSCDHTWERDSTVKNEGDECGECSDWCEPHSWDEIDDGILKLDEIELYHTDYDRGQLYINYRDWSLFVFSTDGRLILCEDLFGLGFEVDEDNCHEIVEEEELSAQPAEA